MIEITAQESTRAASLSERLLLHAARQKQDFQEIDRENGS
jgi:hypothetical protein